MGNRINCDASKSGKSKRAKSTGKNKNKLDAALKEVKTLKAKITRLESELSDMRKRVKERDPYLARLIECGAKLLPHDHRCLDTTKTPYPRT